MYTFWPHSPNHQMDGFGIYMITSGTYQKQHFLQESKRRTDFCSLLFQIMLKYKLELQAWAVLSNHYHLIIQVPNGNLDLKKAITELHRTCALRLNRLDNTPGRKVWFNYWDSMITYPQSYYARLHYVHTNPVHHRIVPNAGLYPHCSYSWFIQNAPKVFVNRILQMDSSRIRVNDEF